MDKFLIHGSRRHILQKYTNNFVQCSITLCSNFRSTFGPTDVLTDSVLFCIAESEFLAKNKNLTLSSPNLRENWEKSSFLRFFESKIEGNIFCQSVFLMKVSITIMIYKKVKVENWIFGGVSKFQNVRIFEFLNNSLYRNRL